MHRLPGEARVKCARDSVWIDVVKKAPMVKMIQQPAGVSSKSSGGGPAKTVDKPKRTRMRSPAIMVETWAAMKTSRLSQKE